MSMLMAIGDLLEDIDLESLARETAREAARVFRAMRDARVTGAAPAMQIVARLGPAAWTELHHPGPWSVSLEPRATIFAEGAAPQAPGLAIRPAAGSAFAALFRDRPDVQALIVTRTPGLAAAAQAGVRLTDLPPLRQSRLDDPAAAVLAVLAQDPTVQALLLADGRLVAWSEDGVLAAAERVMALEDAAQIRIQAAILRADRP
jgi:hypothetical protein